MNKPERLIENPQKQLAEPPNGKQIQHLIEQQVQVVADVWHNPVTGFTGARETLRRAKELAKERNIPFALKQQQVLSILREFGEWQLNAPKQVVHSRARHTAADVNYRHQADLIDMNKAGFGRFRGKSYLLTVVDVYSRYAMALPISNKKADTVLAAWKLMEKEGFVPSQTFATDEGGEFAAVGRNLPEGVLFIKETPGVHTALAIVNRFHKTLERRLATASRALKINWVDLVDDVVEGYNTSKHRSLGATPAEVYTGEKDPLRPGGAARELTITQQELDRQKRLNVGVNVRIATDPGEGARPDRSFFEHWSDELFVIIRVRELDATLQNDSKTAKSKFSPAKLELYTLYHPATETTLDNSFYANELLPFKRTVHLKKANPPAR